ncbi:MAG: FGGY family carbohydrate kinase, partial [Limnochordia bacterium]
MAFLLGLDIGTSGVKALLMADDGTVRGSVTVEYPLYSPRPGWTEQNPEDMWQASVEAVRQVLEKCAVKGSDVMGVGLSGQMHSSVFLDEAYQVIR